MFSRRPGVRKLFFKTVCLTRVYTTPHANIKKTCGEINAKLLTSNKQSNNKEECDVMLLFCPVVSRAGTDIEAALSRWVSDDEKKPTIMFVLHHTFDTEYIAPSSSRYDCENLMLVDVLFHEDTGLLKCSKNNEAIERAENYLKRFSKNYHVVNWCAVMCTCLVFVSGLIGLKKSDWIFSWMMRSKNYSRLDSP